MWINFSFFKVQVNCSLDPPSSCYSNLSLFFLSYHTNFSPLWWDTTCVLQSMRSQSRTRLNSKKKKTTLDLLLPSSFLSFFLSLKQNPSSIVSTYSPPILSPNSPLRYLFPFLWKLLLTRSPETSILSSSRALLRPFALFSQQDLT